MNGGADILWATVRLCDDAKAYGRPICIYSIYRLYRPDFRRFSPFSGHIDFFLIKFSQISKMHLLIEFLSNENSNELASTKYGSIKLYSCNVNILAAYNIVILLCFLLLV